jgi:hypothetical protein
VKVVLMIVGLAVAEFGVAHLIFSRALRHAVVWVVFGIVVLCEVSGGIWWLGGKRTVEWEPPVLAAGTGEVLVRVRSREIGNIAFGASMRQLTNEARPFGFTMAEFGWMRGYAKNNRFYLLVDVPSPSGEAIRIRGDRIGPLPPFWDANYNAYAAEVVNGAGAPEYQVSYVKPNEVEFVAAAGIPVQRIFKYPRLWHPGELAR